MSKTMIGKTIRRLRSERGFTQQAFAQRLGVSTSYLNLLEHDERNVTASLLFKLTEVLGVDLAALSGTQEREFELSLREVFSDPELAIGPVPDHEVKTLSATPQVARAVLTLHRALLGAREEGKGITLPSGRKILLPTEEVRDFFHMHANHFPSLEAAAEMIGSTLETDIAGTSHALAERLRHKHNLMVSVQPLPGALRVFDPARRMLILSEDLPRESRGFQMAFQLALLEAKASVEALVNRTTPTTEDAAVLIRIGLLNYVAGALLMPYQPFLLAARSLRYDVEALVARFGVSYEQVCHRFSTLQRDGARGVPFFFFRVDGAGNISKRFSAAGFPLLRSGGTCPRWVTHSAFTTPGSIKVQIAELSATETFLCFAKAITGRAKRWGDPAPVNVVAMGCDISNAKDVVYGDGMDFTAAAVGIGLSCRMCERPDCRSRAFPPIAHRLALQPDMTSASPYHFKPR